MNVRIHISPELWFTAHNIFSAAAPTSIRRGIALPIMKSNQINRTLTCFIYKDATVSVPSMNGHIQPFPSLSYDCCALWSKYLFSGIHVTWLRRKNEF